MRFLIVNDDGIDAPGIRILTEWAKQYGEVTVVAPKVEQSGKSHGIELMRAIEVKEVPFMAGVTAYSMDSTPADCVRYGIVGLKQKYDLVLSGINRGYNVARDIVYSGTVGAIFEAEQFWHKAVAVSTCPEGLDTVGKHLDKAFTFLWDNGLLAHNPTYNINIPPQVSGIRLTYQGDSRYTDNFEPVGENMYKQVGYAVVEDDPENLDIDFSCVMKGIISVTPMRLSRTEHDVWERLNGEKKGNDRGTF